MKILELISHYLLKLIIIFFVSFGLFSCKSYVQVVNTSSNLDRNEGFYVYENDTLRITYNFWHDQGIMAFSIYNKLKKPIYVDWKKSSYIDNNVKLNYWIDEEIVRSYSIYAKYIYNGPVHNIYINDTEEIPVSASISNKVKPERITFIPPKSFFSRSDFYIILNSVHLEKENNYVEVPRNDKPRKETKVYMKTYDIENTPLVFRNFLTFSLSEDFNKEFYVDNLFYISEVLEMDQRHFSQYKWDETRKGNWYIRDEHGNPIKFSNYKTPTSFFLE